MELDVILKLSQSVKEIVVIVAADVPRLAVCPLHDVGDHHYATQAVLDSTPLPLVVSPGIETGRSPFLLTITPSAPLLHTAPRLFCNHDSFIDFSPVYSCVDPGQSPHIPSLPHLLLYLLVSFFSLSYSCFICLLAFHPFPFYQNSPTPFPRPDVIGGD